jgi:prevent-host-death family protein
MTVTVFGSREARAKWRDLLDTALAGTGDVIIERSGRPVAALISYADYMALAEELDDLRAARRAQQEYEEYLRDPSAARPWEEIEAELDAKWGIDE